MSTSDGPVPDTGGGPVARPGPGAAHDGGSPLSVPELRVPELRVPELRVPELRDALLSESAGFADALRRRPARLRSPQARRRVRELLEELAAAAGAPARPDPPDDVPALAAALVVLGRDLAETVEARAEVVRAEGSRTDGLPPSRVAGLLVQLVRLRSEVTGEQLPRRLLARARASS